MRNFSVNSDEIEVIRFLVKALWCHRNISFFYRKPAKYLLRSAKFFDMRNVSCRHAFDIPFIAPLVKKLIYKRDNAKDFEKIKVDLRTMIIESYSLEELLTLFNFDNYIIFNPRYAIADGKYYEEALFYLGEQYCFFYEKCYASDIKLSNEDIVNIYNKLYRHNLLSKRVNFTENNKDEKRISEDQKVLLEKIHFAGREASNMCNWIQITKKFLRPKSPRELENI